MSDTQDIRRALEQQLATLQDSSGDPRIAWENVDFNPSGETTWLRAFLEFSERRPAGVGVGVDLLYQGLLLVNCYSNADQGTATLDALADDVMDLFTYGTTLTENGLNVKIRFAERAGSLYDKPWYFAPVTVSWYCYF